MKRHYLKSRFLSAFCATALLLGACGDDAAPGADTTTADTAVGDAAGDTAVEDVTGPDAASDTAIDVAEDTSTADAGVDATTPMDTSSDVAADTTEPELPYTTATLTIDGTAVEVTPSIRRGATPAQPVSLQSFAARGTLNTIACEGTGTAAMGGRVIRPTSVTIVGGFGSNCGGLENMRLGEENMLFTARQACSGKVGTCTTDLNENFDLRFGSCDSNNVSFSINYDCETAVPAPTFVVEVPTSFGTLRVEALDGPGEMGCVQRAASATLNGQAVTADLAQPCRITIDDRGPSRIAGQIEATLSLGGSSRAVLIDFASNRTENRNAIQVYYADDICFTSDVTLGSVTEDGDTFDTFTGGAFTCFQFPARAPAPMTVLIRRPRAGEGYDAASHAQRVLFRQGDREVATSQAGGFSSLDHSADRERFAVTNVSFCNAAGEDCLPPLSVVYVQGSK